MRESLLGVSLSDMEEVMAGFGEKPYRAKQVMEWVWKHRVESIEEMTTLSEGLREKLAEKYELGQMTTAKVEGSEDTTRKFLFRLKDGRYVETVLIPANKGFFGNQSDRMTACVSSQVGCAFDCKFCASGLAGVTRNLTAAEIAGQILEVERAIQKDGGGERVNNVVFMGMGEPSANLKNLTKAIEVMTSHWGLNIGARHLTISTSGLAPMIRKLADHPQQIRLAISLHGPNDEVRNQIMPVNEKWNVDELFEALTYWRTKKKQKVTLEYILIKGVNDDLSCARQLAARARSIEGKVNLIPYNTVEGLSWERPAHSHCHKFRAG